MSILKKLIDKLLTNIYVPTARKNLKKANDNRISIFLQLFNKIDNTKTKNVDVSQSLIYSYFNFGNAVFKWYKELKLVYRKNGVWTLVNSEIKEEISEMKYSNDTLQKRMEKDQKMYRILMLLVKKK